MKKNRINKKTKAVIIAIPMGMIMMLCLGLLYAWSIFIVPLESDLGCGRDDISFVFTISLISFCAGGFVIGKLYSKGLKFYHGLLITGLLLFSGFFLSSFADEVWHIYITYGVMGGMGIGIGYNTIITTIVNWFPEKRGFISGLLMMGYGLGPMILGITCTKIMDAFGWRPLFIGIAIVFGAVMVTGALILIQAFRLLNNDVNTDVDITNSEGLNLSQIIRRSDFVIYYIWSVFFGFCCLTFVGNIAPTAIEIGVSSSVSSFLVGMVSLFNGLGRVLMGLGYDKLGLKKMLVMLSIWPAPNVWSKF